MDSGGSVTHWIDEVRAGNREAAQGLWERYFARLVRLARSHLPRDKRRISDEEDVALSVLGTFCRAVEEGRFPDLSDRDGLWRLLIKMTARKSIDVNRRLSRQRRGGGKVLGESAMADVIGDEPTPGFAVTMSEQIRILMERLPDDSLRELVTAKLEGYTNAELARRWNCSERTIERRLRLVRANWTEEFPLEE